MDQSSSLSTLEEVREHLILDALELRLIKDACSILNRQSPYRKLVFGIHVSSCDLTDAEYVRAVSMTMKSTR